MTVASPPRPPSLGDPVDREQLEALVEALIEEARQRARRRRQKVAALAVAIASAGVVALTFIERTTQSQSASTAFAARSSPAAGATSSKIAFMWYRSSAQPSYSTPPWQLGAPELWVMNADGTAQRRLTRGSVSSWSPDGRQVAFERNHDDNVDVYVVNTDGSGLRRLTRNAAYDGGAVWSPDGRRIAFVSGVVSGRDDIRSDVYVMDADGTARRRLTHDAASDFSPAWSPDGQAIVFERHRKGKGSDVYVMNADGSGERKLTRGSAPRWSPDGSTVLFGRDALVYVMNADGGGQRRLARGGGALWSPDGKRILFLRGSAWSRPEVTVMHADGSHQRGLGINSYDGAATWSPDGRKIVFATGAVENTEIYAMSADGGGLRRLTRLGGRTFSPIVSPALTK